MNGKSTTRARNLNGTLFAANLRNFALLGLLLLACRRPSSSGSS